MLVAVQTTLRSVPPYSAGTLNDFQPDPSTSDVIRGLMLISGVGLPRAWHLISSSTATWLSCGRNFTSFTKSMNKQDHKYRVRSYTHLPANSYETRLRDTYVCTILPMFIASIHYVNGQCCIIRWIKTYLTKCVSLWIAILASACRVTVTSLGKLV